MSKRIYKIKDLEDGRELFGLQMDCEVKSIGENEIEIIGSTADMDRDSEVIDPKGWDLKNFKKNPVVLPAHDYRQPAIGRATKVQIKDGELKFRIEFPPEGDYPLADVFRKLYKGGFMKASSVGFIPKEWTDGDGQKNPYRTYTKQELLEISLVSVPSNPNALVSSKGIEKAVKAGVLLSDDVKELMFFIRELMKKEGDQNGNDDNEHAVCGKDGDQEEGDPERNESGEEEGNTNKPEENAEAGIDIEAGKEEAGSEEEADNDEQGNSSESDTVTGTGEESEKDQKIAELEARCKMLENHIEELLKQLDEALSPKHYSELPIQDESQSESIKSIIETAREAFKK